MRKFKFIVAVILGLLAMSCTEEEIAPRAGEDDPIIIPPPPPPPPK